MDVTIWHATLTWNRNGHEVSLMARIHCAPEAVRTVRCSWTTASRVSNLLRGHVQVFDGYGESLIDYNHKATYVGVGV
ncbi:phospholipase, partial [Stenotrophomonas maltophilia]